MSKIARIINGKIVYSDESSEVIQPTDTAARERRKNMKLDHRKDMLQKNQTEYYKAYPEQAENLSPELRRLLS